MFEHGDWRVIGCSAMKINTFYSNMKCNAFGRYYKKYAIQYAARDGYIEGNAKIKDTIIKQLEDNTRMEPGTILACECSSLEHIVVYHHDKDDNHVYMHTHLAQGTFFERIIMGIKYIFGYQSRYGAFDEFILSEEQAPQLRELADAIDACKKENYRRAAEQAQVQIYSFLL